MKVPTEKPRPIAPADPPGYMGGKVGYVGFILPVMMLVAVFVIALIVILSVAFQPPQTCDNPASLACLDQRVTECLALEKYTVDQCVQLVGEGR
jgi:hypothetical protein